MKSFKNFIIYWSYYFKYYFSIKYYTIIHNRNKELKYKYKAMMFALREHHKIRQRYDNKYPYYYHLNKVALNSIKFMHLVDNNINVFLGALFHDLIEDVYKYNYNDIVKLYGKDVAEIVYLCSELRGKNRAERHGKEYFDGLKTNELALFVKICDIISNMQMGKQTGSTMLNKYRKEYPSFKEKLYNLKYKEMFDYIENNLLND